MFAKNRRLERNRRRAGLVITRNAGEQTILDLPDGTACVITARIVGARVKLHIAAPPSVRIRRAELAPRQSAA